MRFLLECVENVNGLRTSSHVYHAVGADRVRNSNLLHTFADGGHRFEIVWLVASLLFMELIACILPDACGEVS